MGFSSRILLGVAMLSKMFGFGSTQGQQQGGNMHDQILGQAMQSQGGGQQQGMMQGGNGHSSNMLGLAGLLLASGVRFKDALPMAAQMAQQEAHNQLQQQQFAYKQLMDMQPDIQDKFNPVTGELVRFQDKQALGISPSFTPGQRQRQPYMGNDNAGNGTGQSDIANKDLATWASNDSGSDQLQTNADWGAGPSNQTFATEERDNAGGTNDTFRQPAPTELEYKTPKEKMEQTAFERKQQLANEKFEHAGKQKIADENRKYLTEESEKAKTNADKLDVIKKMKQSLGDFHQGFGSEVAYNAGRILNTDAAAAAEYFTANGNTLVGDMMKDQSGVQTNQDREYYAQTKPNRTTSEKGNRLLADSLESSYKRYGQYYNLEAKAINSGMDKVEFNRRWREYAENNPVMLKDDKGNWRINETALENANMVLSPNFDKENAKSNILIDPNGGQWTLEEVKKSMSKKR